MSSNINPDINSSEEDITLSSKLWAAWSIHAFTASGVLCALFGFVAIFNQNPRSALVWLLVAQIIDGVDGPLARGMEVAKNCSVIDGKVLDLVIDYLTCVVVPVIFMLKFEIFPSHLELPLAGLILFTSVLWFARKDIETNDMWFRGFPAGWNLVATSLWLLHFNQYINAAVSFVFIVLTMSNVKFFHILSSQQFKTLNITLTTIYLLAMTGMIVVEKEQDNVIGKAIICAWIAYYFAMAIWRTSQGDEIVTAE
ncbi:MAG: CDP-alcohol phosphatidyltransferase family protein [Acidimicrobiia bacterium]